METNGQTLATLKRGEKAIISAVDTGDPLVQRLMTLGLVEGAEIERAGSAIGGDPMEFRLFGTGISLRQEQARHACTCYRCPFPCEDKPACHYHHIILGKRIFTYGC